MKGNTSLPTEEAQELTYEALRANELERNPVRDDGGVPMCNVGKRPGMDKHWCALWKPGHREQMPTRLHSSQRARNWKGLEFEKKTSRKKNTRPPPWLWNRIFV